MWRNALRYRSSLNAIKKYSTEPVTASAEYQSDVLTLSPNDKIHGFVVQTIKDIPEFRLKAIYLQHEKTKAEYLHLYREDNNNLFSVNFRTTPKDSTGSPHILEHTVLCGSKMFPVRDPFFKMLNRSLATFMNAMTGSDYTLYPFSTQNYSDFRNLQRIYLDAVFNPLIKESDFMQEGWRLENRDVDDATSDLMIKGVVYNEMKGVFSENENIFVQKVQNSILPDHTYGIVSGGDPKVIPILTWDGLKQFHKEHYHPSNCRCFSYGNFPLLPSLEYINNTYFQHYAYSQPTNTVVPRQKRWSEPKREHISCRFDPMGEPFEKQNAMAISLLLSDCTDIYNTFLMQFVTELLVKGPNSAFYKALIEPNFSSGFTPCTGLDTQSRDTVFTVSLKGITKGDFTMIEEKFNTTLDEVIKKGFSNDHVESLLHSYELQLKNESKNFGLSLLFGLSATWNHTTNILPVLEVNNLIDKLKDELKNNPKYLQQTVEKFFKNNTHKLILTMSPDKQFEEKLAKDETELIKQKTKNLNDKDKQTIFEKCQNLKKLQETPQETHLLPTLIMDDISSSIPKVNKVNVSVSNVPTQINKVNANGLVYFKAVVNTYDLSQEQQMLLPLFCYVINKMGTDKMDYKEFDNLVNRKTAGLSFNVHIADSLYDLHTYEPGLLLGSYCLEKNAESMWDLWNQLFNITKLDNVDRFKMLTQLYMSNLTHGITDSGHLYAMQAAASMVSGSSYQAELLNGLHHISYMKRLLHTSNYNVMLKELKHIATALFNRRKMRVALNICPENHTEVLRTYEKFIVNLPGSEKTQELRSYVKGRTWHHSESINCQHHVLNVPVNYCSKAILTTPYTKEDHASLKVLARLLSAKYLHPELREKRGAYGAGAKLNNDGVFTFYTYRDPKNTETLDVFDNSHLWLQENLSNVSDQDLLEAKLGVFQTVDAPIPPGQKGCEEFLKRLTPEVLQRHRAEIMCVSKKNLGVISEKYLGDPNVLKSAKVILGPKSEKLDLASRKNEMWSVLDSA